MEVEEKRGEKRWIVGGDFNARTGERGQMEEGDEEGKRRLKDKGMNKKEEELIKWMEEEGWGIMNGVKEEEEEGEITFTGGRRGTVIDYVIERR